MTIDKGKLLACSLAPIVLGCALAIACVMNISLVERCTRSFVILPNDVADAPGFSEPNVIEREPYVELIPAVPIEEKSPSKLEMYPIEGVDPYKGKTSRRP